MLQQVDVEHYVTAVDYMFWLISFNTYMCMYVCKM